MMRGSDGQSKGWKPGMYPSRQKQDKVLREGPTQVVEGIKKISIHKNEVFLVRIRDMGPNFDVNGFGRNVGRILTDQGIPNLAIILHGPRMDVEFDKLDEAEMNKHGWIRAPPPPKPEEGSDAKA